MNFRLQGRINPGEGYHAPGGQILPEGGIDVNLRPIFH